MGVEETYLKGCYIIYPKVFEDERGYFFESFNKEAFERFIQTIERYLKEIKNVI